jgi:glucose-1-phosphate adenylyltransferase
MPHCECVAMILAGGQGSRLGALTKRVAKPAVPFGGKYRIIDFPLSNCANSGMYTVGVLTQYQPLELNTYIGSGQSWDMDRIHGGVYVLPPFQRNKGGEWYKGTANAIYQNISFIEQFSPEYVLVLSGDHIYKMDYRKMLSAHKENGAEATIAVIDVPLEEASRYGILSADENQRIFAFEEKPANPKSTLASMGVYIFNWVRLREYLLDDEANEKSTKDFGHDLIPAMLRDERALYAYRFEGYWKDVGTIQSLWAANMDMLGKSPTLNLYDTSWRIYSRNTGSPPHFIADSAEVQNSCITEGCQVYGRVNHSVLFTGVVVEEGAEVTDSIVFPRAVIKKGAKVHKAVIAEDAVIGEYAVIGSDTPTHILPKSRYCEDGLTIISEGVVIGSHAQIGREVSVEGSIVMPNETEKGGI